MTASMHASAITSATIRVVGQVPTDISLSHLGTPEREASLRIGELLIYLNSRELHQAGEILAGRCSSACGSGVRSGLLGWLRAGDLAPAPV
jgi:hypothetical protein